MILNTKEEIWHQHQLEKLWHTDQWECQKLHLPWDNGVKVKSWWWTQWPLCAVSVEMSEKPKLSLSGYHASRIGSATHSQVQSGKDARNSTNTSTTVETVVHASPFVRNIKSQTVWALNLRELSQKSSVNHNEQVLTDQIVLYWKLGKSNFWIK